MFLKNLRRNNRLFEKRFSKPCSFRGRRKDRIVFGVKKRLELKALRWAASSKGLRTVSWKPTPSQTLRKVNFRWKLGFCRTLVHRQSKARFGGHWKTSGAELWALDFSRKVTFLSDVTNRVRNPIWRHLKQTWLGLITLHTDLLSQMSVV